jgi:hypothetical protein
MIYFNQAQSHTRWPAPFYCFAPHQLASLLSAPRSQPQLICEG